MFERPFLKLFRKVILASMGAACLLPQNAFAWGDMGHQIVGEVAERAINPTTRNFVQNLMGIEPLYVAATWPDHVRDDKRFAAFAPYHFCEIPTGYTYENRPNKDVKDCHGAITHATELLEDTSGKVPREEKIIALRYLIHVMGDIHQPLHVGNGHDVGGNVCSIRWQDPTKDPKDPKGEKYLYPVISTNLHSFWDTTLVEYMGETFGKKPAKYLPDYMTGLKNKFPEMFTAEAKFTPEAKEKYSAGNLDQWLAESQQIRDSGIYPDDPELMKDVPTGQEYMHRPYCDWFVDPAQRVKGPGSAVDPQKIPLLAEKYASDNLLTVETQLLKGGLRLAATLDKIAVEVAKAGYPRKQIDQVQVINDVQKAFDNPVAQ